MRACKPDCASPSALDVTYRYDAMGRRVAKDVATGGTDVAVPPRSTLRDQKRFCDAAPLVEFFGPEFVRRLAVTQDPSEIDRVIDFGENDADAPR